MPYQSQLTHYKDYKNKGIISTSINRQTVNLGKGSRVEVSQTHGNKTIRTGKITLTT